ncbi:tetratricopeptide repeat-like superfamily protein [Tanacetum coccineum]
MGLPSVLLLACGSVLWKPFVRLAASGPQPAWNLHEANNELELVDKELSKFDENENRVITYPEYLTGFNFNVYTMFQSAPTTSGIDSSEPGTSHFVVTPTDDSRPILHDINGEVKGALYLFDEMPERNETTWNTVISVLSRVGLYLDAFVLFGRMCDQGFEMSGFVIAVVE